MTGPYSASTRDEPQGSGAPRPAIALLALLLACHGQPSSHAPATAEPPRPTASKTDASAAACVGDTEHCASPGTNAAGRSRAQRPRAQQPSRPPPTRGEEILVEAGTLLAGSRPGVAGRNPKIEADLAPVAIHTFRIDRLPYPNDPSEPPVTGMSRPEAQALCEASGKRLCHELEWERACRGDSSNDYPSGDDFDVERCSLRPAECDAPTGAAMMGVLHSEWTASGPSRGIGNEELSAIVKGAAAEAERATHRCGARAAASPLEKDTAIGFRCCRGEMPSLAYPDVGFGSRFRTRSLTGAEARVLLEKIPELAPYASDFRPFRPEEIDAALSCGEQTRETLNGWEIAEGLLRWSPHPGDEVWIIAGRGGGSSLLAALYPLANGGIVHAGSFVLHDDASPIALAFTPPSRKELLWSSCWGRAGDDGSVIVREDGTLLVAHH